MSRETQSSTSDISVAVKNFKNRIVFITSIQMHNVDFCLRSMSSCFRIPACATLGKTQTAYLVGKVNSHRIYRCCRKYLGISESILMCFKNSNFNNYNAYNLCIYGLFGIQRKNKMI